MVIGSSNKNRRLPQEAVGQRFSKLVVIDVVPHSGGRHKVKCICDCGQEKIAVLSQLKDGRTNSCGCLRKNLAKTHSDSARLSMIDRGLWQKDPVISAAKKVWHERYDDGDIPFNRFYELSQQNCFYCNKQPSNKKSTRVAGIYFIYNGLDRVDNNGIHDIENVVTCCYFCNISKSNRTTEDFLNWIEIVFRNKCLKND